MLTEWACSYELPHRIHCTAVYPTRAPNGSTIIIYGHERGLRILWKAGRRRGATPRPNGVSKSQEAIAIDGSEGEPAGALPEEETDEYEDEEDEQDPDCPYAGVVHDFDLELKSAVIHLAIPATPNFHALKLTRTHAIVALACTNGATKLLCIPLAPPKENEDPSSGVTQVDLPGSSQPARSITAKLLLPEEDDRGQPRQRSRGAKVDAEILVALVSSTLNVYAVDVITNAIKKRRLPSICSVHLASPGHSIRFHPSHKSTQLLLTDATGAVRIYDPFTLEALDGRPGGKWMMTYLTSHKVPSTSTSLHASRKRTLACSWILSGRAILALLEDGEWGVWDVSGSLQSARPFGEFAISGYLGTAGEAEDPARSKKPSKLAPMTPNTRKTKSDTLFSSAAKAVGATSNGGISLAPNPTKSGQPDESILMWYGGDIYSIPSMQQFWQRSTTNNGSFGSLYAPGMTHLSDVDLVNENISSISQLPGAAQASSLGQMNTQRDLVISAEYRMVITQANRAAAPSRQLFEQAADRPASRDRDQRMLDAGDLDLGGLNRMLDSRVEGAGTRKVGFAY